MVRHRGEVHPLNSHDVGLLRPLLVQVTLYLIAQQPLVNSIALLCGLSVIVHVLPHG